MAGTAIKVTGSVDADLPYGYFLPAEGFTNWHLFGGTQAKSLKNYAPGGAALGPVGAPVYQPSYAELTGSASPAAFTAAVADTPDMTMFAVVRRPDNANTSRRLISNGGVGGADERFASLFISGAGSLTISTGRPGLGTGGDSTSVSAGGSANSNWLLVVARIKDGVGQQIWNMTSGETLFEAIAGTRILGTQPLRIGSSYSTSGGRIDMAFSAVAPTAYSDAAITDICAFIRQLMAAKPTPIVV